MLSLARATFAPWGRAALSHQGEGQAHRHASQQEPPRERADTGTSPVQAQDRIVLQSPACLHGAEQLACTELTGPGGRRAGGTRQHWSDVWKTPGYLQRAESL